MSIEEPIKTSREVRHRIDFSLLTRNAPRGTRIARLEEVLKHNGAKLWHQLKKRPSIGVALVGGIGLTAATLIGVGELTLAIIVGYGAYQVLREGVPPKQEAENIVKQLEDLR